MARGYAEISAESCQPQHIQGTKRDWCFAEAEPPQAAKQLPCVRRNPLRGFCLTGALHLF